MRILFLLSAVWPLIAGSAFGWGCEGHQVVALIAEAHLTPAASAAVNRLLRENPIDPALNRFCKDRPDDLMADSSTWADDTKNIEKTGEWHYIDIPLAMREGDAMRWCAPIGPLVEGRERSGCIVDALGYEWNILRDKRRAPAERAKALRYVIHLVGDLAQPLHATDNHDQGGNCTSIRFFAIEKPQNLHGIWDYEMIEREFGNRRLTPSAYAAALDREFAGRLRDAAESEADFAGWAWQSHDLAASIAYGDLRPGLPLAAPDAGQADRAACELERAQSSALHVSIGDAYMSEALPVIHEQLAKAAYRLAAMLNQTFR